MSHGPDWKHSLDIFLFAATVLCGVLALSTLIGCAWRLAFIYRASVLGQ